MKDYRTPAGSPPSKRIGVCESSASLTRTNDRTPLTRRDLLIHAGDLPFGTMPQRFRISTLGSANCRTAQGCHSRQFRPRVHQTRNRGAMITNAVLLINAGSSSAASTYGVLRHV